jgi:2-phospho-L-lactate guanylyltransferase
MSVQATVARFDPEQRSGAVLLDDGRQMPFEADALDGTGLRLLRPGQRVRLDVRTENGAARIERLQILTLT